MDARFLEAWGNYLIAAAKGSESLEALSSWVNKDSKSLWSLPAAFCQLYGIDVSEKPKENINNTFQEIQKLFVKNYSDAIIAMGAVPKTEHDALIEKYNTLKKKNEEQTKTIEKLQLLLATKQIGADKVWDGIQGLTKLQENQIRNAMDIVTKLFETDDKS
ncbi:hypothetical protein DSCO28_09780 [Desulfosarcina ovata subsp. sediminis]|uniref:Uncharacterized protein n=1 Tax=Desulfosarcina ovata subsp. sediminis TaxID=885957 RepID=A0A5K7ZED7_9BACT|nr:hypothetical protein [Desulfosarcina ovata]BBO80412.1 hypothetical protein DSCO28_09780 [Desulfosarcina ovata subsp. sediminis]